MSLDSKVARNPLLLLHSTVMGNLNATVKQNYVSIRIFNHQLQSIMKHIILTIGLIIISKTLLAFNLDNKDTVIVKNTDLKLVFTFETFECGINIFKHPLNKSISHLDYNVTLDTAIYTYSPKKDFIGIDTVIFIIGCGSSPGNILSDTTEYIINVTGKESFIYYYNESQCADIWHTGQNSTDKEREFAIKEFLRNNKVKFDTIWISSVYGLGEDCMACPCLSGNRYYVTSADYYSLKMSELGFSIFIDSTSNPHNTRLSYSETQCSDPWYGEFIHKMPPSPQLRLYELALFLDKKGISFISLEIMLTIDFDLVDLCLACNCGTGYSYDIIVNDQFVNQLKELGFTETCMPIAGFSYSFLLSNPIQLDLSSTAKNADSIVWKSVSKFSQSDTIVGYGKNIRLQNLNKLLVTAYDCMNPPCPSTIDIKQVVINSCGDDSVTIAIPDGNYTLIDSKSSNVLVVYPNPTNGNVSFKGLNNSKTFKYFVIDSNGRKLIQGALETELNLNLPNGLYFLFISDKDRIIQRDKIIIKNCP